MNICSPFSSTTRRQHWMLSRESSPFTLVRVTVMELWSWEVPAGVREATSLAMPKSPRLILKDDRSIVSVVVFWLGVK